MLNRIYKKYSNTHEKIHSKYFSFIHLYMLKDTKNRLNYFKSMIRPTEVDYEKVEISQKFHFLYFFLRPLNIISKFFKHKFNK